MRLRNPARCYEKGAEGCCCRPGIRVVQGAARLCCMRRVRQRLRVSQSCAGCCRAPLTGRDSELRRVLLQGNSAGRNSELRMLLQGVVGALGQGAAAGRNLKFTLRCCRVLLLGAGTQTCAGRAGCCSRPRLRVSLPGALSSGFHFALAKPFERRRVRQIQ